jgi:pSer/pThr/pTyr-binding forkhead associated (FHA) protein
MDGSDGVLDSTRAPRSPRCVLCDVCGRNNADNLTFCQDCGRRLRQQRGVAPTPPNGLPRVELAAVPVAEPPAPAPRPPPLPPQHDPPQDDRGSSPSGPPSAGRRARPAAPVFSFAPAVTPKVPPEVAAEPVRQAPAPPPSTICTECRSPNPPEYRFCVACGAPLRRAGEPPAERPAPTVEAAPRPAVNGASVKPPAPFGASDGDPIVGAPVVDIAASGAVPAKIVTCARCHGHCVAGTRFCKYCGAPLDEAPRARAEAAPAAAPASEPLTPAPLGKIPLVPVNRPVAASNGGPISSPSFSSGVRPALNPPTPLPGVALQAPSPAPAPAPTPVYDGAPAPVAIPVPVPAEPAPRPVVIKPPSPPRVIIESLVREGEPGIRSEVSALAGSPVPVVPLIPSPPPPRHAAPVAEARPAPAAHGAPVATPLATSAHEAPARPQAPARWQGGRLVVIVEDGSEGRSFSLAEGQLDIGRTDGDIVLEDDPYVSPRHARLRRLDGLWILRDLDSTNHVYVRLRKPHPLRDGDLLLLGLEVLQFQTVSDGERGLGHAMQHGTFLFGSPATPRRARLCQRTVEGVIRDVYHLFRDETIIGREVGDIVFTADPFLSRRHAAIRRNPVTSEFALLDLDSSNGTYVAIRGEVGISDGDFLRIGQHLFRVDLG